jgi:hypothetical protein
MRSRTLIFALLTFVAGALKAGPPAPVSLTATATGVSQQVALQWSAVTVTTGALSGYHVYYNTASSVVGATEVFVTGTATALTLTALPDRITEWFFVAAEDMGSGLGTTGTAVSAAPFQIPDPVSFTATPQILPYSSKVFLSWVSSTAYGTTVGAYKVEAYAGSVTSTVFAVPATTLSATVTAACGQGVSLSVRAYDAFGSSSVASAPFLLNVPCAPILISVGPSAGSASATWSTVAGAAAYEIRSAASAGAADPLPILQLTVTASSNTTQSALLPAAPAQHAGQWYRIHAVSSQSLSSAASNEVAWLPPPTDVRATGNVDKVFLSWSSTALDAATSVTAYQVYYGTHQFTGSADPLSREAQAVYNSGTPSQGVTVTTGLAGSTQAWWFRVSALSGGKLGPESLTVSAYPVVPSPSFSSALALSSGALTLGWSAVDPGNGMAVLYSISRSAYASLTAPVFVAQAGGVSVTVSSAGADAYYYVGASLTNGAQSLLTPPASSVLFLPYLAPPAVTVTATSNDRVKLAWSTVPEATSYLVFRSTVAGLFTQRPDGVVTGLEYVDTAPVNTGVNTYEVLARAASPYGQDLLSQASPIVTAQPMILPSIPGRYGSSSSGSDLAYLTAVAGTSGGVDLRWTAAGAGSSAIAGYRLWRGWSAQSLSIVASLAGATNTAYADPTAPQPLMGLIYGVEAVDLLGFYGPMLVGGVTAPSPLPPVQNLQATVKTGGVSLAWAAPNGQGSYPLTAYVVSRRWQSGGPYDDLAQVTVTTYTDLTPAASQGSQPSYQVQALDIANGRSAGISVTAQLTPVTVAPALPSAVSGVAAVPQALAGVPVILSWRPNPQAELISGYLVYRGASLLTQTAGLSYSDSPGAGTTVSYSVQALNAQGVGVSGTAGPLFVAPPQPPVVSLTASVDPFREGLSLSARITWTDLSAPAQVDDYVIYAGTAPFLGLGSGTQLATLTTAAYEDFALSPSTKVFYSVLARSSGAFAGTPTAQLTLTLPAPPGTISGLTGTATSTGAALSWSTGTAATEYWVFRSTSPMDAQPLALTRIARTGGTSYTDTAGGGTSLNFYAVAAVNGLGRGPAVQIWLTPSAGTPGSLALSAGFTTQPVVNLSWSAPAGTAAAASYDIWRDTDPSVLSSGGGTFLLNQAGTTYVDSVPTTNTAYWYAVNGAGAGTSPRMIAGPVRAFNAPSMPIHPLASGANGAVDLSWEPASSAEGVTGWALSLSINNVPSLVQVAGNSSYRVGGLSGGMPVTFSVQALNSAGGSLFSVSASALANSVGAAQMPISFTTLSGFSGGLATQAKVELSWSAPGAGVVLIYRSTAGPMDLSLAHGGPASSLYLTGVAAAFPLLTDTVQALGQVYQYAISALSSDGLPLGESVPRLADPVTVWRAATLPGLSGTAGDGRVDLIWGQPSDTGSTALAAAAYRLHRQTGGGVPGLTTIVEDSGWPRDLSGNSFVDLTAVDGNSYWYLLSLTDVYGNSTRDASYIRDKTGAPITLIPQGPPQPPSPIIAVPGDDTVVLRWVASLATATSGAKYNVYRRPLNGDYMAAVPQLTMVGPSATEFAAPVSYTVLTLRDPAGLPGSPQNLTPYAYSIAAVNSWGEGPKSPEVYVTPFRPLDPGSGPAGAAGRALSLIVVGKKDISLSWGPTADAPVTDGYTLLSYRVYRSQDGGSSYSLITSIPGGLTLTTFVDNTTSYGTAYTYRVVPVDSMLNEGYSYNLQTVVIPAAVNSLLLFRNGFDPAVGEKLPVQYALQQPGHVWVKVFTLNGEHVATIFNEDVPVASPDQPFLSDRKFWDGTNTDGNLVASGVYLVHMEGPGFRQNARVAVIK